MLRHSKMLGDIASGFLETLGLGRIATNSKLGLNSISGNSFDTAKDVFDLVEDFASDSLKKAGKQPPLGDFQTHRKINEESPLTSNRLTELLRAMGNMFGGLSKINHSGLTDGLRRIFGALSLLQNTFNSHSYYDTRASESMFIDMSV